MAGGGGGWRRWWPSIGDGPVTYLLPSRALPRMAAADRVAAWRRRRGRAGSTKEGRETGESEKRAGPAKP
jgi:hypothetical protein